MRDDSHLDQHTIAFKSFDVNTDKLLHLYSLLSFSMKELIKYAHEVAICADEIMEKPETLSPLPDPGIIGIQADEAANHHENIQIFRNAVQKLADKASIYFEGCKVLNELVPVLMVTTVEAYLKDVLAFATSKDPTIMRNSKQWAIYGKTSQPSSLEKLRNEWVKDFFYHHGPDYWITELDDMGVRGYASDTAIKMEQLWGIRHTIIHSAGVATPDFVSRHPTLGYATGDKITIHLDQVREWNRLILHFVEVTDAYFFQRCNLPATDRETSE